MTLEPDTKPSQLSEQLRDETNLRELLETYAINGLGKPIYTIEENRKKFEGIFLPLGNDEKSDWLCILPSGKIMRLKPPQEEDKDYKPFFLQDFYYKEKIVLDSKLGISYFLENPTLYLPGGSVVYRNDSPYQKGSSSDLQRIIDEDLQKAREIALSRKNIVDEQEKFARESALRILDIFGGTPLPTSDNPSS